MIAVPDHREIRKAHGFHLVRVKEVVAETDDTRSFVLDIPDGLRDVLAYQAGQFCTFRVRLGDDQQLRSYSMSSAPGIDDDLTVTVKRVPGGLVSNWFIDEVSAGDVVELTRPAGVFTVRDGEHPLVAFCGGSGITPVMSIAKAVLGSSRRSMKVLYANRDHRSVIFERALCGLARQYPDRFELRHHFDSEEGFVASATVEEFAAGALDADFYICGPQPFMDLVESTLAGLGVEPDHILLERFDSLPPPEPARDVEPDADVADDTEPSDTDAETTGTVTVILNGKKQAIAYHPGDTVLDTARRGGLQPPFSCEAGDCATCMALMREGSVAMRTNNALTPEEVDEGWVLTCQSVPESRTVVVEYEPL